MIDSLRNLRAIPVDWTGVLRRVALNLLIGVVFPSVAFYLGYAVGGAWCAIWASFGAAAFTVLVQMIRSKRVLSVAILALLSAITRTLTAIFLHSPHMFFIQPLASTEVFSVAFAVSSVIRRPLTVRLAGDLLPAAIMAQRWVLRYMARICWLWSGVISADVGSSLWVWLHTGMLSYQAIHVGITWALEGGAALVCIVWFAKLMHRHGEATVPAPTI